MQRLFLIAWSAVVIIIVGLMVLLDVSLIPHFTEIGDTMIWFVRIIIACAAVLIIVFTYSLSGRLLSKRRREKLMERVIVAGEVVAAVAPNGDVIHLSAMHVAAGVPRMLPTPKEEELVADDQAVIEMYNLGDTYETIMKQCNLKYNKVQRIVSEAKRRGDITK